MTACTSTGTASNARLDIAAINTGVEYIGPGNIPLDPSQQPGEVLLSFPFISGAIFGIPDSHSLFLVKVKTEASFSLDLASKQEEINQLIQPMSEEWQLAGLQVEPQDTRLGRLGSFAFDASGKRDLGGGGFIDAASRNHLVLIYVDRACTIKGTFSTGTESFRHDVRFDAAGFHWLEFIDDGSRNFRIINYTGKQPVFSIKLKELLAT